MKNMQPIKTISIFFRDDNKEAVLWNKKIRKWMKEKYPSVKIVPIPENFNSCGSAPDVLLVLGGDGTIIEMAQRENGCGALIMGLNLGHVGFMASVRKSKDFLKGLEKLLSGKFRIDERMKIKAEVIRKGKKIAELNAINEISIQSLLGIVELKIDIEKHPLQYIRGSGVMVSTASGSTAYNLSAHGPIVMPEIDCFIITELFDHNLPTPSIVIKEDKVISVDVKDFRQNDQLLMSANRKSVDVLVVADGVGIIPLEKGDKIVMKKSSDLVRFIETEPNYFFKSLKEKFAFK